MTCGLVNLSRLISPQIYLGRSLDTSRISNHVKRTCDLLSQNSEGVGNYCSEFAAVSERFSNSCLTPSGFLSQYIMSCDNLLILQACLL